MISYIYFLPSGQIVGNGNVQKEHVDALVAPQGASIALGVSGSCGYQYFDLDTKTVVSLPAKPGEHYVFNYTNKLWILDLQAIWEAITQKRNALLTQSDWVVLKATEQGIPVDVAWQAYRQQLRDITKQDDPLNLVWPEKP